MKATENQEWWVDIICYIGIKSVQYKYSLSNYKLHFATFLYLFILLLQNLHFLV